MKSKDVEVGKVYGWREGKSVYDSVSQLVFLAPLDELYSYRDRSYKIYKSTAKKPKAHSIYPSDGYLVAIGTDVTGASLADAMRTGVSWGYGREERTFNYRILTNMATVLGPDYATAHAAQEAARKARNDAWDAQDAQRQAKRDRSQGFVDRLALHGVKAWKGDHGGVEIWGDEADKLMALLESPPHQVVVSSMSDLQQEILRQAAEKED